MDWVRDFGLNWAVLFGHMADLKNHYIYIYVIPFHNDCFFKPLEMVNYLTVHSGHVWAFVL